MRGGIEGRMRGSIRLFENSDKASKNKELHHTPLLTSLSSPTFGGSIGRSAVGWGAGSESVECDLLRFRSEDDRREEEKKRKRSLLCQV